MSTLIQLIDECLCTLVNEPYPKNEYHMQQSNFKPLTLSQFEKLNIKEKIYFRKANGLWCECIIERKHENSVKISYESSRTKCINLDEELHNLSTFQSVFNFDETSIAVGDTIDVNPIYTENNGWRKSKVLEINKYLCQIKVIYDLGSIYWFELDNQNETCLDKLISDHWFEYLVCGYIRKYLISKTNSNNQNISSIIKMFYSLTINSYSLVEQRNCNKCNGYGEISTRQSCDCMYNSPPECNWCSQGRPNWRKRNRYVRLCTCHKIEEETCSDCDGEGYYYSTKQCNICYGTAVNIPLLNKTIVPFKLRRKGKMDAAYWNVKRLFYTSSNKNEINKISQFGFIDFTNMNEYNKQHTNIKVIYFKDSYNKWNNDDKYVVIADVYIGKELVINYKEWNDDISSSINSCKDLYDKGYESITIKFDNSNQIRIVLNSHQIIPFVVIKADNINHQFLKAVMLLNTDQLLSL
eukprot:263286_1